MPTVPLEDGRLRYEERGDGPALVCLHGGWQNADSWHHQVDRFADEFRVVTFDLRGHGRTGATDARRYSIDLFADDLDRLLTHLDVDDPILSGISIGGLVVQSYLDARPDAARGAVIGGPLRSFPPFGLPSAVKPFVSPLPAIAGMMSTVGSTATVESLFTAVSAATGGPWLSVDPAVHSRAKAALRQVPTSESRKVFRALYDFVPPDLSHVRTPTLVIYGDHEAPAIKRQGGRLADSLVNGSCVEIPDAGHLVNEDNPEAFNDACAAFFANLAPREEDR